MIEGLRGREPIGAVLRVGKKGPRGNPVDRDRFYIAEPTENSAGVRPEHPQFSRFNGAPPDKRTKVNGVLVHAVKDECFELHLKAQVLPGRKGHPDKRPACTGNGKTASRWTGKGPMDYQDMACPHRACEFRQGNSPACKPWFRFMFRPVWADETWPTPLMKLTSSSWNSAEAFEGFFAHIHRQAEHLGLEVGQYSLYGMPFTIGLSEKSQASKRRRFPVLTITPTIDVQTFLVTSAQQRAQIEARPVAALPDKDQQDPAEKYRDYVDITPSRPAIEGPKDGDDQGGLW